MYIIIVNTLFPWGFEPFGTRNVDRADSIADLVHVARRAGCPGRMVRLTWTGSSMAATMVVVTAQLA